MREALIGQSALTSSCEKWCTCELGADAEAVSPEGASCLARLGVMLMAHTHDGQLLKLIPRSVLFSNRCRALGMALGMICPVQHMAAFHIRSTCLRT